MKIENLCINCMREKQYPGGVCEFCGFDERTFQLPRHHIPPFSILEGKYLIGNAIGEGGFGITYIGLNLNLESRVAIKEYYPQGFAVRDRRPNNSTVWSSSENTQVFFEQGREKFVEEARTVARFRDLPEIVGVIDFFRENHTAYIVMEYLDGRTLKQYLKMRGGKIPAGELVKMMQPLIASLGKLHSQNLIHRDISPDNIMVMRNGSIKILDFGGAKDFVTLDENSMSVVVKHGYAPEEQYKQHGDQGPWTDVYALCATMYRCITGETPPKALDRLHMDTLKPISSFGVNCPKYIEQTITKGLSVHKGGRYCSMGELYNALYGAPQDHERKELPNNHETTTTTAKKPEKTKVIVIAAVILTAIVGISAIGIGLNRKTSDPKNLSQVDAAPTEFPVISDTENTDVFGKTTSQGYENPYLGFKINLPSGYIITNEEDTTFYAESDRGIIQVYVEALDEGILEGNEENWSDILTETEKELMEYVKQENFDDSEEASIDQVEFIGKTHWALNYTQNEIPTRLFNIISDDGNYLITIALSGVDTDEIEQIETYFSTM
mgnify:FL=1